MDDDGFETPPAEPGRSVDDCYRRALQILAGRDHSRIQLARKLSTRGFEADTIDAALARLVEDRYLDEDRFKEQVLASGLRRGHGPHKIQNQLRNAGVASRGALGDGEIDWLEQARACLLKKFGVEPAEDERERARRARFLQQRGFPSDVIGKALRDRS